MPNAGLTSFYGSIRSLEGGLILGDINNSAFQIEERFARVTIPSSEILTLFSVPKVVVPAPGPGQFLEFLGATIMLDATATAYVLDTTDDLCCKYTDAAGAIVSTTLETTGFLDQTTDQVRTIKSIVTDVTPVVNAPLVLHMLVSEVTTGTGVLYVNVSYRIHQTGL